MSLKKKGQIILENAVYLAIEEIEAIQASVDAGALSRESAQEKIRVSLIGPLQADGSRTLNTPINLGENGYFLAYDNQGYEVMHPNIEGEYVFDVVTPDKDKIHVVQEQIRIGKKGGFFDYNWYYPNQVDIGRKMSYSKYEPKWGWTLVATTYASDFNQSATRITLFMVGIFSLTVLLALIYSNVYIKKLLHPIYAVTQSMKSMSDSVMPPVPEPKENDELMDLVQGYNAMLKSLSHHIKSLKDRKKELRKIAFYDDLSGLPNLNYMTQHFDDDIKSSDTIGHFILLDIKSLKMINSLYGLSFGDDIIKSVAQKLKNNRPTSDSIVTRLGGNEFGIWVPTDHEDTIVNWINTTKDFWRNAFYEKQFIVNVDFTVSYVAFHASTANFEDIYKKNTIAMQYAKTKDLEVLKYSKSIYNVFEHESVLKIHAETGLKNDEFYPVYQSKVVTSSGKVIGVEALARWTSDILGPVGPGEFIPIFNKTKLILELTEKMIDYVMSDYKALVYKFRPGVTVSINISPLYFMNDRFVEHILNKSIEYDIPRDCIVLEITEDVFIDNIKDVNRKINILRENGFKISLDDFGSGYSSLNYLQKSALMKLKLTSLLLMILSRIRPLDKCSFP